MKNQSLSRAFSLALLSAVIATLVGCSTSKMTSSPQPTSTAKTPTKEYEWHDMSTGKGFFGSPLPTNAQAQQSSSPTSQ